MSVLTSLFRFVRTRPVVSISTVLVLVALWQIMRSDATPDVAPTAEPLPIVTLTSGAAQAGSVSLRTIGTVRAFSSGEITAERGGRVIAVPVTLGQSVAAGQIIAQLENATERAAVTQAEGALAAAEAAASQSVQQNDSGIRNAETALRTAENGMVSAIQASYNTANNTLLATVDQFFSNPLGLSPGIRIGGTDTSYLRRERIAFQGIMEEWSAFAQEVTYNSDTRIVLDDVIAHTERLLQVVDHLIAATTQADNGDVLNGQPVTSYTPILIAERAALVGSLQNLRAANLSLTQAEEARRRAEIGDTSGNAALSEAQIQQARGALEAARANLAKTILRSPVAGTVNALSVRTGDFISPNSQVATVANNTALEIVTFINPTEQSLVAIGDTVRVNETATGTVVAIAPAVDPVTRKVEVRIALSDTTAIQNGDTVTVTTLPTTTTVTDVLTLPLTAIRFADTDGFVFQVSADNRLERVPVTLGAVRGSSIIITGGIEATTLVVADARGLTEGDAVTIRD
jgi:RND family efflux transporter MFP subunit